MLRRSRLYWVEFTLNWVDKEKMNIDAILSELGGQFGIPNLCLNKQGVCVLHIDDTMEVAIDFDPIEEIIRFHGVVSSLSSVSDKDTFKNALCANSPAKGKGFNYFCIDSSQKELVLINEFDAKGVGVDYSYFSSRLESFVDYFEYTQQSFLTAGTSISPLGALDDHNTETRITETQHSHDEIGFGMRV